MNLTVAKVSLGNYVFSDFESPGIVQAKVIKCFQIKYLSACSLAVIDSQPWHTYLPVLALLLAMKLITKGNRLNCTIWKQNKTVEMFSKSNRISAEWRVWGTIPDMCCSSKWCFYFWTDPVYCLDLWPVQTLRESLVVEHTLEHCHWQLWDTTTPVTPQK